MKSFVFRIVMLSVFFTSIEGAVDIGFDGHPFDSDHGQQFAGDDSISPDTSPDSGSDADHCEQCCHGHVVNIPAPVAAVGMLLLNCVYLTDPGSQVRNLGRAPPTPPPNA